MISTQNPRSLRRNYHFTARITAFPDDTVRTVNSFWVCGNRISVVNSIGEYTNDHHANSVDVMAHVEKLVQQEITKLKIEEELASNITPTWTKTTQELVDAIAKIDIEKLRVFVSTVPETRTHFRFAASGCSASECLFLIITDVMIMLELKDQEGALAYAEALVRDVSGTMIDRILESCSL